MPRLTLAPLLHRVLVVALWACAMVGGLAQASPAKRVPSMVEVAEAAFVSLNDALSDTLNDTLPEAAPQSVRLPDTWAQRGLSPTGQGRYRVAFALEGVPPHPYGVSMTRVSSTRRVFLNGRLIEDTTATGYSHPVRAVIMLPPLVLRPGENDLVIEVTHRIQGGLSPLTFGPTAELSREEAHRALRIDELPRSLNLAMALLAVFMLLVRWRRPSERTMGLFGALSLLGSVRNYSYYMEVSLMPVGVGDWIYFCAQVWTVMLFVAFALSLHPQRRRNWLDRSLVAIAIVVPLAAALTSPIGGLPVLRKMFYPVLLLSGVGSLAIIWQAMRQDRSPVNIALVGGFTALVLAGMHDYAFQQGMLPVTDMFWIPVAMPLAFGVYGLMQMNRFVRAMNEVDHLNQDLEHRVQQRTLALQAANAAKTRFLAAASHDLRQPVAAIGLMVSLMREQVLAPALRKMVDRVDDALASMEALLKGLLDLSRLESGTVRARPERVPLQPMFDAIALHEGEVAARKGLRLDLRPTPLSVRSDPLLLEQILRNLVSNAVRYTDTGRVLVVARPRGDKVLLQVWDTGVGIAEADQALVFEEFAQVGNPAREASRGLGLGLSIVRRGASLLAHPLHLRSRVGRGSCFSLTLPREDSTAVPAPVVAEASMPLTGRRITVVEDDPIMLDALAERLRAWGAQVRALDGVPALRASLPPLGAAREADPQARYTDLLITDHRLPGGSGLLVIELVRQRCGATRAMVVTGDTAPGDLTVLQASGLPVLHKPFRAEELLATIERALRSAALGELPAEG